MNSNKISCQKYVFEQNKYNSSPVLEFSVKFASQICHENTSKPLDGAYLAHFGIDISGGQDVDGTQGYCVAAGVSFRIRSMTLLLWIHFLLQIKFA